MLEMWSNIDIIDGPVDQLFMNPRVLSSIPSFDFEMTATDIGHDGDAFSMTQIILSLRCLDIRYVLWISLSTFNFNCCVVMYSAEET